MNISDDIFSAAVHYEAENVEITEGIGISDVWLITVEISKDEILNKLFKYSSYNKYYRKDKSKRGEI